MNWKEILKTYKPLAHGVQNAKQQGKTGAHGKPLDPTDERMKRTDHTLSTMIQGKSADFKRIEQIEDKEEQKRQLEEFFKELGIDINIDEAMELVE